MSERKSGWYWVRYKSGAWRIGEYHESGIWRITSSHMNHYDHDFKEIGPRIPAPGEDF